MDLLEKKVNLNWKLSLGWNTTYIKQKFDVLNDLLMATSLHDQDNNDLSKNNVKINN